MRPPHSRKRQYPDTVTATLWDGTCDKCYRVKKGYDSKGRYVPVSTPEWINEIRVQCAADGLEHFIERRRARGVPEDGWNIMEDSR